MSNSVENLTDLPVQALLQRFARSDPTPGGGSAASLAGAVGSSLVAMVAAVSLRKADSEETTSQFEAMETSAATLGRELKDGVTADANAYDGVRAAFTLPKATDEEKKARKAAIQAALKKAAETPLLVAQTCLRAANLAREAIEKGNPNVVTDGAVGLLLALTGIEGAVLNVAINLDSIQDQEYVSRLRNEARHLLQQSQRLRAELWATLAARLPTLPEMNSDRAQVL